MDRKKPVPITTEIENKTAESVGANDWHFEAVIFEIERPIFINRIPLAATVTTQELSGKDWEFRKLFITFWQGSTRPFFHLASNVFI